VANICMRKVSALHCDPIWATCCKESVTAGVVGPILLVQALRGITVLPSFRILALLAAVGLANQVVGNAGAQWAFGVVGLAVIIPTTYGTLLIAGAVLGRVMLGEHVSPRTAVALAVLLLSIAVLGCGAGAASRSVAAASDAAAPGTLLVGLAIVAGCLTGMIYAILGTTMRHCLTGTTSLGIVLFVITFMGTLSLGPMSVCRLGLPSLLATPPEHCAWLLGGGFFNLLGFVAVAKGLQLTTVVRVNMLNVSQVALAAVGGIVLFSEPPTPWLLLGVALTIAGIFLMGGPPGQPVTDQHA
jgi:drug/metabolite transporter (DMT)-like permease